MMMAGCANGGSQRKEKPSNSKGLSLTHSRRDERKKAATNGDKATPEREKSMPFPLAEYGDDIGSGRCQ